MSLLQQYYRRLTIIHIGHCLSDWCIDVCRITDYKLLAIQHDIVTLHLSREMNGHSQTVQSRWKIWACRM